MNRTPDNRSKYKPVLYTLVLAAVGILLACGPSLAQDASKPGNCTACHAGKQVLSDTHPDTKEMKLQQCMVCHGKDKIPLGAKFLSIHEQMLSGGSSLGKAAGAAGKDAEMVVPSPASDARSSGAKTLKPSGKALPAKSAAPAPSCTACHSGPEYGKHFSKTKHGDLQCSVCHKGVTDIPKHVQDKGKVQTASCLTCHKDIGKQGLHATVSKFSCAQCHPGVHPDKAPSGKAAVLSVRVPAGDCASCHSAPGYERHFTKAAGKEVSCAACHKGVTDLPRHMKKEQKPELVSCGACHKDIEQKHEKSVHAVKAKLSCLQCHTGVHSVDNPAKPASGKAASIETCLKCHSDKDTYVSKGHSAKVLAGNENAASCSDCHGTHDVPVFAGTGKGLSDKREHYTGLCISCHKEDGPAGRSGTFPGAVKAYGETYHGKAMSLGYRDKVAGCTDCHAAHNILPPDDPASALNAKALVETCGKCHTGFHPRFVSYVAHPDPDDPKAFLGLYLTKKFMIALLAGVFVFFWVHSLLWWIRAYAEKKRMAKEGLEAETNLPEGQGMQYVRRFTMRERVMHVVLILSFFGVVISGFPVKYTGAAWARPLIALMGGAEGAALIHRISAAAMCLLFLYTCWLSCKFLFPGFKIKGWVGRLFGPDSLFPRLKDFEDCFGMFRWFFNRGDKPQFDRWTYWEKFDFMAVFWGMFVIGLSGMVMWMPELSSYIMPGWMINIVHLAHSEEAFLAAVFIFTIHFFNNHIVPDKFPLEKIVFTGSYTVEALKRERPLEYERILGENRLEEITCERPGTGSQLFARVFGIASVLLGLALTVLIFWAVFMA